MGRKYFTKELNPKMVDKEVRELTYLQIYSRSQSQMNCVVGYRKPVNVI